MRAIIPKSVTDAVFKSSTLAEADADAWSNVTTYAADALVMHEHHVYKSLQASNVGKVPGATDSATWWSDQGPTNRWKMFDDKIGTVSTTPSGTSSMSVELDFGRCSGLALFGLDATTLYSEVKDSAGTLIWSETTDLTRDPLIGSWLDYFVEPILGRTAVVKTGLPIYGASTLKVTVSKPSGTVGIGNMVIGRDRFLGLTKWKPTVRPIDYSRKSVDSFGHTYLKPGNWAKKMDADLYVETTQVSKLLATVESLRGIPAVFIGDNRDVGLDALTVWGWVADAPIVIEYLRMSTVSIEINGLI